MTSIPLRDRLRLGVRAVGFTGWTFGMYGLLEVATLSAKTPAEVEATLRDFVVRYGRGLCKIFGLEIQTEGLPEGELYRGTDERGLGRVFLSNHRSGLDVLVTLAHLEGRHVSRADLASWPVIGVAARRAGVLFVDRGNKKSGSAVVQAMIDAVEKGQGVIIYPEGTTFTGDEVRPFKAGALTVARRTGCEIVPVGLAYAGEHMRIEEDFAQHMQRAGGAAKTRVALVAGEAYRLTKDDDHAEETARARERVQAAVNRARELVGPG